MRFGEHCSRLCFADSIPLNGTRVVVVSKFLEAVRRGSGTYTHRGCILRSMLPRYLLTCATLLAACSKSVTTPLPGGGYSYLVTPTGHMYRVLKVDPVIGGKGKKLGTTVSYAGETPRGRQDRRGRRGNRRCARAGDGTWGRVNDHRSGGRRV